MRVLRVLSQPEIRSLQPLFGNPANGGFIRLRGSARQYLNPTTGELVTRREYDKSFGTLQNFPSYEAKAKERKRLGVSTGNPRKLREITYPRMQRTHTAFHGGVPFTDEWFNLRGRLQRRFGRGGNPTIHILAFTEPLNIEESEAGVVRREYQTRSIGAFNDSAIDLLRRDIRDIETKYNVKITDTLMVWVHDARK